MCRRPPLADLERSLAEGVVALGPVDADEVARQRLPGEPGVLVADRRDRPFLGGPVGEGHPEVDLDQRVREQLTRRRVQVVREARRTRAGSRDRHVIREHAGVAAGMDEGFDALDRGRQRDRLRDIDPDLERGADGHRPERRGAGRSNDAPEWRSSHGDPNRGKDRDHDPGPGAHGAQARPAMRWMPRPFSPAPRSPVRESAQPFP